MINCKIEPKRRDVTFIYCDVLSGSAAKFLIVSDVHFDSKYCDKFLLEKHFKQAKHADAKIIIMGDWFDAMQAKHDKRAAKMEMTRYDSKDTYFNSLIEQSAEFLEPYIENIALIAYGNHETAVMKHNDIDLTRLLAAQLNATGGNIQTTAVSGFIVFRIKTPNGNARYKKFTMFYSHQMGGNAPRTKGILGMENTAGFIDADIIVSGHNHKQFIDYDMRMGVNRRGEIILKDACLLKMPTYKCQYRTNDAVTSYAKEKTMRPSPLGGWFIEFATTRLEGDIPDYNYSITRAN